MVEIRVAEAAGEHDRARLSGDIFDERFLIERPLLQALRRDAAGAPVLLIDELDRSDEPFERSEEHTSELQSLMRISYPVFCLKKNKNQHTQHTHIKSQH